MSINEIPKYLLICVLLTIVIELSIAILLGVRDKKDILNITLINITTNLFLNISLILIQVYISLKVRNNMVIPLEILVVFIEGLVYKKVLQYKKINPYILSFILNLYSYVVGLIIF